MSTPESLRIFRSACIGVMVCRAGGGTSSALDDEWSALLSFPRLCKLTLPSSLGPLHTFGVCLKGVLSLEADCLPLRFGKESKDFALFEGLVA